MNAACKSLKQRKATFKSLEGTRAHKNEQLKIAQKVNEEVKALKGNLMETSNKNALHKVPKQILSSFLVLGPKQLRVNTVEIVQFPPPHASFRPLYFDP